MSASPAKDRLQSIQLLRAFAALFVVVLHSYTRTLAAQPDPNRVWVKYKPGAGASAEAALKAAGAHTHYRFDRLRAFAASDDGKPYPAWHEEARAIGGVIGDQLGKKK